MTASDIAAFLRSRHWLCVGGEWFRGEYIAARNDYSRQRFFDLYGAYREEVI